MNVRQHAAGRLMLCACAIAALAGCAGTPLGPTVQVMPGHGKSFDAFQNDQAGCKSFAASQVSGQADSANQRAAGAALLTTVLGAGLGAAVGGAAGSAGAGAAVGAAAGAGGGAAFGAGSAANDQVNIQQQYDNAFAQCMYARGDQVPGFAPNVAGSQMRGIAAVAPDPLVRSTQNELIRLGYLRDAADGYMGERTRSAIATFEQGNGLPQDGSPSPQLLARLQSTSSGASSATASSSSGGWVSPASARTSPGVTDWVQPASTPAPATGNGWVAPAKTP